MNSLKFAEKTYYKMLFSHITSTINCTKTATSWSWMVWRGN